MHWWEQPRTGRELAGFTSEALLDHRARVTDAIDYWRSGWLPRSPFSATREDAEIILTGLRHELYELNRELWRRGYTAVRMAEELAH